jgi:hypothetical protein
MTRLREAPSAWNRDHECARWAVTAYGAHLPSLWRYSMPWVCIPGVTTDPTKFPSAISTQRSMQHPVIRQVHSADADLSRLGEGEP